nr:hypothetical protein CFP56_32240 [Quercus suber]
MELRYFSSSALVDAAVHGDGGDVCVHDFDFGFDFDSDCANTNRTVDEQRRDGVWRAAGQTVDEDDQDRRLETWRRRWVGNNRLVAAGGIVFGGKDDQSLPVGTCWRVRMAAEAYCPEQDVVGAIRWIAGVGNTAHQAAGAAAVDAGVTMACPGIERVVGQAQVGTAAAGLDTPSMAEAHPRWDTEGRSHCCASSVAVVGDAAVRGHAHCRRRQRGCSTLQRPCR